MSPLLGLWLVSLALSAVAMVILFLLITARTIAERRDARLKAKRRELTPLILAQEPPTDELILQAKRYPDLVAELVIDLVHIVRGDARRELVDKARQLGSADRLHRRLRRGPPRERLTAVEALGKFDTNEAREWLHEALADQNGDVRLSAAIALASSGAVPSVARLIERLDIGGMEESRHLVSLFRALAETRGREVRQLILDPHTSPVVRRLAIEALPASGDYALVDMITRLALDLPEDAPDLPVYLNALAAFGHPRAAPAIERGLASSAWPTRAVAARAAGSIGLDAQAGRLCTLLGDASWWVRFRAAEALARLGPSGKARLRQIASGEAGVPRETAAALLAEQGLA